MSELNNATLRALKYVAGTPGTRIDPYHVVKISAAFTVDLAAGGTDAPDIPYGVIMPGDDDPADAKLINAGTYVSGSYEDGKNVSIVTGGECQALVGTAGITFGSFVMADASGHVVDYTPGGYILGQAMETASSGAKGRIRVHPMATASTSATSIAGASVFLSGELTGNGSAQGTAHGLATVPAVVIAIPSDLTGGAFTVAYGTHTTKNAVVTVTNGEKYRVLCIK